MEKRPFTQSESIRHDGDASPDVLADESTFHLAPPTYEVNDTFELEKTAEVVSLQHERQVALHARVDGFFATAPNVLVRDADRLVEMIHSGALRSDTLVRDYALLTDEYRRLAAFTKEMFPGNVGMQALSLDAVIAVQPKRLSQIMYHWGMALRRADGVEQHEGESPLERLVVHADILAEGIRSLREAAERLDFDVQREADALPVETTEEKFGVPAK